MNFQKIVECVPNFSEGRDQVVIEAIANEIRSTDQVKLLDVDPGRDTNRTVITFVGSPEGVKSAAFKAIRKAAELIDMRIHKGAHARIGATDVCPLVPISGVSVEECLILAAELGKRVGEELGIPVYLYEKSATRPERQNLADIRQGEYEGLAEKLKDPNWRPDFGKPVFNPRSGATVIGVREFLIAYNINLNTKDRRLAHDIALTIRESGRAKRDQNGNIIRDAQGNTIIEPGLLKACKSVGWYIDQYGQAQISMNLVDFHITPPHVAFETVCQQAQLRGLRVTGSELIGLIPLQAMLMAGRYYLEKQGKSPGVPEEELVHSAILSLGLNDISKFDPQKKIIEYQIKELKGPLVKKDLRDFVNELSMDSPAPGGGSVAALSGSLASALVAMVSNITYGKKEYQDHWQQMKDISIQVQTLKDQLLQSIDDDSEAFNQVLAASRLPQKTEEQQKIRIEAIQTATRNACLVPLKVMEQCLQVLKFAQIVAQVGYKHAITDAGVAVLMAFAAIRGAELNVRINLASLDDMRIITEFRSQLDYIKSEAERLQPEILKLINQKIANPNETEKA